MGFTSGYSTFFQMCDTMEGVRQVDTTGNGTNIAVPNATVPGPQGVGLDKALPNFAAWYKNEYLPDCKYLRGSCRPKPCRMQSPFYSHPLPVHSMRLFWCRGMERSDECCLLRLL